MTLNAKVAVSISLDDDSEASERAYVDRMTTLKKNTNLQIFHSYWKCVEQGDEDLDSSLNCIKSCDNNDDNDDKFDMSESALQRNWLNVAFIPYICKELSKCTGEESVNIIDFITSAIKSNSLKNQWKQIMNDYAACVRFGLIPANQSADDQTIELIKSAWRTIQLDTLFFEKKQFRIIHIPKTLPRFSVICVMAAGSMRYCDCVLIALHRDADSQIVETVQKELLEDLRISEAEAECTPEEVTVQLKIVPKAGKLMKRDLLWDVAEVQEWDESRIKDKIREYIMNDARITGGGANFTIRKVTLNMKNKMTINKVLQECEDKPLRGCDASSDIALTVEIDIEARPITEAPKLDPLMIAVKTEAKLSGEQMSVALRILDRARILLGDKWETFTDVQFLVLTPVFTTLKCQTQVRVERDVLGCEPGTVSHISKIVFTYDTKSDEYFREFKSKCEMYPDTLCVIVADECHWGITKGGAHDLFLNDAELNARTNFLSLLVSATPYNVLTMNSRIPDRYFKPSDLESLPITREAYEACIRADSARKKDFEELHVVKWFPPGHAQKGALTGAYLRLEWFLRSVAPKPLMIGRQGARAASSSESTQCDVPNTAQLVRCDMHLEDLLKANCGAHRESFLLIDYAFSFLLMHEYKQRDAGASWSESGHEASAAAAAARQNGEGTTPIAEIRRFKSKFNQVIQGFLAKPRPSWFISKEVEWKGLCYKLKNVAEAYNIEQAYKLRKDQKGCTETDLITQDLLRDTCRHMYIIRMSKNDVGAFSGHFLRHIRNEIGSRRSSSAPHFGIIEDFGSRSLYSAVEHDGYDSNYVLPSGKPISSFSSKLQYEDLYGVPCVLIVTQRGRMGDTFPQSLVCLDLRVRTSENTSTFIQDVGRMCRYPRTKRYKECMESSTIDKECTDSTKRNKACVDGEMVYCVTAIPHSRTVMVSEQVEDKASKFKEGADKLCKADDVKKLEPMRVFHTIKKDNKKMLDNGKAGSEKSKEARKQVLDRSKNDSEKDKKDHNQQLFESCKADFEKRKVLAVFAHEDAAFTSPSFIGYARHVNTWESKFPTTQNVYSGRGSLHKNGVEFNADDGVLKGNDTIIIDLHNCKLELSINNEWHCRLIDGRESDLSRGKIVTQSRFAAGLLDTSSSSSSSSSIEYRIIQDVSSLEALISRCPYGGSVHELVDDIPYVLVPLDIMKKVETAVSSSHESDDKEVWECLKFGTLDRYTQRVRRGVRHTKDSMHDYRNSYEASKPQKGSPASYDHRNSSLCTNRILLFAECQIGKTGAYCYFLKMLIELLRKDADDDACRIVVDGSALEATVQRKQIMWALPFWKDVQDSMDKWQGTPTLMAGKYHRKVRLLRWQTLVQAVRLCSSSSSESKWVATYFDRIRTKDVVKSESRQKRLHDTEARITARINRNDSIKVPLKLVGADRVVVLDKVAVQMAINWDAPAREEVFRDKNSVLWALVKDREDPLHIQGVSQALCASAWNDNSTSDPEYILSQVFPVDFDMQSIWDNAPVAGVPAVSVVPPSSSSGSSAAPLRAPRVECKVYAARVLASVAKFDLVQCYEFDHSKKGCILASLGNNNNNKVIAAVSSDFHKFFEWTHTEEGDSEKVIESAKSRVQGRKVIWVFTPSYRRHGLHDKKGLLDRKKAVELSGECCADGSKPYIVQVLVVRQEDDAGNAEFEQYRAQFGADYIVVRLPSRMDLKGGLVGVSGVKGRCTDGIGYARLVAQLLAYDLKIEMMWMIDDNVKACITIDLENLDKQTSFFKPSSSKLSDRQQQQQQQQSASASGQSESENNHNDNVSAVLNHIRHCSFADAIVSIENQVLGESDSDEEYELMAYPPQEDVQHLPSSSHSTTTHSISTETSGLNIIAYTPNGAGGGGSGSSSTWSKNNNTNKCVNTRRDFCGPIRRDFAVIGMSRDNRKFKSDVIHMISKEDSEEEGKGGGAWKSFHVTHSVYSFFLLNVKRTVEAGVFFPSVSFWEDIEFNQMCRENQLLVLKCKTLLHVKDFRMDKVGNLVRADNDVSIRVLPGQELELCSGLWQGRQITLGRLWDEFNTERKGVLPLYACYSAGDNAGGMMTDMKTQISIADSCTFDFCLLYDASHQSLQELIDGLPHGESVSNKTHILSCIQAWCASHSSHTDPDQVSLYTTSSNRDFELPLKTAVWNWDDAEDKSFWNGKELNLLCSSESKDSRINQVLHDLKDALELVPGIQATINLLLPSIYVQSNRVKLFHILRKLGKKFGESIKQEMEMNNEIPNGVHIGNVAVWSCHSLSDQSYPEDLVSMFIVSMVIGKDVADNAGTKMPHSRVQSADQGMDLDDSSSKKRKTDASDSDDDVQIIGSATPKAPDMYGQSGRATKRARAQEPSDAFSISKNSIEKASISSPLSRPKVYDIEDSDDAKTNVTKVEAMATEEDEEEEASTNMSGAAERYLDRIVSASAFEDLDKDADTKSGLHRTGEVKSPGDRAKGGTSSSGRSGQKQGGSAVAIKGNSKQGSLLQKRLYERFLKCKEDTIECRPPRSEKRQYNSERAKLGLSASGQEVEIEWNDQKFTIPNMWVDEVRKHVNHHSLEKEEKVAFRYARYIIYAGETLEEKQDKPDKREESTQAAKSLNNEDDKGGGSSGVGQTLSTRTSPVDASRSAVKRPRSDESEDELPDVKPWL